MKIIFIAPFKIRALSPAKKRKIPQKQKNQPDLQTEIKLISLFYLIDELLNFATSIPCSCVFSSLFSSSIEKSSSILQIIYYSHIVFLVFSIPKSRRTKLFHNTVYSHCGKKFFRFTVCIGFFCCLQDRLAIVKIVNYNRNRFSEFVFDKAIFL